MSVSALEMVRHAEERGTILRCLAEEYSRAMTSVRSLGGALELLGSPMSPDGLQFALCYLADQGYILVWRPQDLPGFRSDRMSTRSDTIVFAKLTPKGLLLIDGRGPVDEGVRF